MRTPKRSDGTLSAVDNIYHDLLRRVLAEEFVEGQPIRERDLAAEYHVSVTPVHEALVRLEIRGLVQIFPRRGAVIRGLTVAEATGVLELRDIMESYAGSRITTFSDDALEELGQRQDENLEAQQSASDPVSFLRLDAEFHGMVIAQARNPVLVDLYESCDDRLHRMRARLLASDPSRQGRWLEAHRALRRALGDRDAEGYRLQLHEHLFGRDSLGYR